jgi:hypothetical protein
MADQTTQNADEAAAGYWRSVAAMTKTPERAPERAPVDEDAREIKTAGPVMENRAEPDRSSGGRSASASATGRPARRRL